MCRTEFSPMTGSDPGKDAIPSPLSFREDVGSTLHMPITFNLDPPKIGSPRNNFF